MLGLSAVCACLTKPEVRHGMKVRQYVATVVIAILYGAAQAAWLYSQPAREPVRRFVDPPSLAKLERAFVDPPPSAKPHTWWHWMDGNVTREGITLDLEAMRDVGIGGAQIFQVAVGLPKGPVIYNSAEWRALIQHAIREANRLGLEICLHNCAGWSSSGGPWVKPEHAMQMVVSSELRVRGPAKLNLVLPQPPTRAGYYRDIAVIAFRTPRVEAAVGAGAGPKISASSPGFDPARVVDGDPTTVTGLSLSSRERADYVQFECPSTITVRSIVIVPGGGAGQRGELQVSDDGETFRKVCDIWVPQPNLLRCPWSTNFEASTGRIFRLAFTRPDNRSARVNFAEIDLEPGFRISNYGVKAGYDRGNPPPDRREILADEVAIDRSTLVDLTTDMDIQGRLHWEAPPGDWTIIRFGHTPTGKDNHPAEEEGRGLEVDKLSREACQAFWAGMLNRVIAEAGPLAGRTLKQILIDSYEVDCQNWTPRFREEFQKRRGYDPWPYLPVLTGRVVHSLDVSERFLWDFRRTIADLYADNYWGYFAERCHAHGMELATEPYGNGNFDDLIAGGRADMPMTEFWVGSGGDIVGGKLASSIAHTYGRKYVGAESFTATDSAGKWQNHPYKLKALGDIMWCAGVNRFIFHRYAHQPWRDLKPGMTMGPWGFHCERTVTWWEPGRAWMKYLARAQYLLQEGRFVADILYFAGEGSPSGLPGRDSLRPSPPAGYDYDGCDTQVLLNRVSVQDGRLVLPDGMSYVVLVLPDSDAMTPPVLRKVAHLVRSGAVVVGPKPSRSPSLQDYPECDRQVRVLADEVWGQCDGKTITEHAYGKGKVIWGQPIEQVLASLGLQPDFVATIQGKMATNIHYIHRILHGADVYFVSNQLPATSVVQCSFRTKGKQPELWHPDTGRVENVAAYRVEGDRTIVPLKLDPAGSVFVVFRKPYYLDHVVAFRRNGEEALHAIPAAKHRLEIRQAVYGVLTTELPDMVEVTQQLRALVRDNTLSIAATNEIAGDPAPNVVKQLRVEYLLDGKPMTKTVEEGQVLTLPEPGAKGLLEIRRAYYGIIPEGPIPTEPRTVDVTQQLASRVRDGRLTVIANNDLAGDPAHLVVKQLRVDYLVDGQPYTKTVWENQTLELPDGTERGVAKTELPYAALSVDTQGKLMLTAWNAGEYEAQTASGSTLVANVASVPEPLPVSGPWELRFPPNLGAPDRIELPELMSWTNHDEPGVKYFSGTASYFKHLSIPREMLQGNYVLVLDLGTVREIAEVMLNGKNLGVLWKPPFRVEVTQAARPGLNELEVRVTNLWPNRLIGDEQLPPDAEYNPGGAIKAWPQWLLERRPRPSGRIAFTTWHHWRKDSPLIESGLLGPVTLRVGRMVRLTTK